MNNNTSTLSAYSLGSSPSRTVLGDRPLSPSRARLNELGQRFADLHTSLEVEKINKTEGYEQQIKQLDDQITKEHYVNEEIFRNLKQQILKLNENMKNEVAAKEVLDDRKTKETKLAEKNLSLDLETEKRNRKETEQQIVNKVDEKIFGLRLDVTKEQKKEDEIVERQTKEVIDQISDLQQALDNEKRSRQEGNEKIGKRLEEEIQKMEQMITKEKKVREATENILFKMLEDINNKLQTEINTEQNTRAKAEEQMLSLLEETCNKIETQFKYR